MTTLILLTFVLGYILIALEGFIHINKTAISLITGVLCWVLSIFGNSDHHEVSHQILEHIGDISGILFFLMSAMTIVELIDAHDGFDLITKRIHTTNKRYLLWILSWLTFFLSAVLDNLTTTIVLVTLLRKLIDDRNDRLLFASVIIIAANAGGAWSPIGDVTTTMLWIGNQITSVNIIQRLFLPSVICLLVPLTIVSFMIRGNVQASVTTMGEVGSTKPGDRKIILFSGLGVLVFVPIFKTLTHLPPFMGILFGLGVLWLLTEILHARKEEEERHPYSVMRALERMDMPSVLFFLGILLAIAALQSSGQLEMLAGWLDHHLKNTNLIGIVIGFLSAIVDNVPMVAGAMGMYPLSQFPTDHSFWEILAYCTGTGGSILIIGSAAGVAAMGLEKIEFFWYLKKISWLALIGFFSGVIIYLLEESFLNF